MSLFTHYGTLTKEKTVHTPTLKARVAETKRLPRGTYATFIPNNTGRQKLIIIERKPLFQKDVVRESHPLYGVEPDRRFDRTEDSFDSLGVLLTGGFQGRTTTVYTETNDEWLQSIADGKRMTRWGIPTQKEGLKGDRYFLSCLRSNPLDMKSKKPQRITRSVHYAMGNIHIQDLRLNVLLGTENFFDLQERVALYQAIARHYDIPIRFYDKHRLSELFVEETLEQTG